MSSTLSPADVEIRSDGRVLPDAVTMNGRAGKRRAWAKRVAAGIGDQGATAGIHFLVQILAARALSVEVYGGFAMAYAILVLAQMLHNAVVAEPLIVFGSPLNPSEFRRHLGHALWVHAGLMIALLVVSVPAAFYITRVSGGSSLGWATALSAAVVSVSTLQFVRRAQQARGQPQSALWGATGYAAILGVTALMLYARGAVTGPRLLWAMSLAALASSLVQIITLRPRVSPTYVRPMWKRRGDAMLRYGGWAAAATTVNWMGTNAPYLLIPALSTVAQSAVFRAAMNAYLPFQQLLLGVSAVALPGLARRAAKTRSGNFDTLGLRLVAAVVAGGLAYGLVIAGAARWLVPLLYGHKFGTSVSTVILLGAVLPAGWACVTTLVTLLRAVGKSDAVFRANLWAFLTVGLVGTLVGAHFGAVGATVALVLLQIANSIWLYAIATRTSRKWSPS